MAIDRAASGVPIQMRALGVNLAGEKTTALLKAEQLELVRIVLHAGQQLREHSVDGEITFLCLEGRFDFTAGRQRYLLGPGELLHLARKEPHSLRAVEDASALLTICLPQTSSRS